MTVDTPHNNMKVRYCILQFPIMSRECASYKQLRLFLRQYFQTKGKHSEFFTKLKAAKALLVFALCSHVVLRFVLLI
jgi:hypothetical protein